MLSTIKKTGKIVHAQLCYQAFITPVHLPLEKKYRGFAKRACEFFDDRRSRVIHVDEPQHHVIHHFSQRNPQAKKVLLVHGWMSRAAYMAKLTATLHAAGYEVFVPDFPAHGEAKGIQLKWPDAVSILRNIINEYGPFHAVVGHSFGGSMVLNTLNIAGQLPEWQLNSLPEKVIMMASPTRMHTPVNKLARKLKLNGSGYQYLKQIIHESFDLSPTHIRLKRFISQGYNIPFLCLHGDQDETVDLSESKFFCEKYEHSKLNIIEGLNHVDILMDPRIEKMVLNFLESPCQSADENRTQAVSSM